MKMQVKADLSGEICFMHFKQSFVMPFTPYIMMITIASFFPVITKTQGVKSIIEFFLK